MESTNRTDALPAIRQRQQEMIETQAIHYHKRTDGQGEGEYGCNGLTCPGVQRLIAFAQSILESSGLVEEVARLQAELLETKARADKGATALHVCQEHIWPVETYRPVGWLDGEITLLTFFMAAHPDCDVRALLESFARLIETATPKQRAEAHEPAEALPGEPFNE